MGKPIWIAVPTFRRPSELRHLLETLAAVVRRDDVMLLVADNDAEGRGGEQVVGMLRANGFPLRVTLLSVPEPGLCAVRNAICTRALADTDMRFIAMIDDDEWPQPGWLDALLACQARVGADVVAGPVDFHFLDKPPRWAKETLVFRPEQRAWGATDMLWASNNLLVSRRALGVIGQPLFDPRFNRSGGEDLDFLTRLRDAGARFGWAPDARVSEWVPAERARLSWVLKRMWRIGFTETLTRRKQRPGAAGKAMLLARTLTLLGMRTAGLALLMLPRARRVDIAGQWVKCWGRLYALSGRDHSHYGAR